MKIKLYREIPNPLSDFGTPIAEGNTFALNDETIKEIGDRYKELLEMRVTERPKAKWLKHGYSMPCSNCGYDTGFANTFYEEKVQEWHYCPNCGARME